MAFFENPPMSASLPAISPSGLEILALTLAVKIVGSGADKPRLQFQL